jgi:hypothetical protein
MAKGMEEGVKKGIEQGIEQGRIEEARRLIRKCVAVRFSALGDLPQLDLVSDAERLEELMQDLIAANSLDTAAAAVSRITA